MAVKYLRSCCANPPASAKYGLGLEVSEYTLCAPLRAPAKNNGFCSLHANIAIATMSRKPLRAEGIQQLQQQKFIENSHEGSASRTTMDLFEQTK